MINNIRFGENTADNYYLADTEVIRIYLGKDVLYEKFSLIPQLTGTFNITSSTTEVRISDNLIVQSTPFVGGSKLNWGDDTSKDLSSTTFPILHTYSTTGTKTFGVTGTVRALGKNVFMNCTQLTSLSLPDSLTEIGYTCIYGCTELKELNIGSKLKTILASGIYGCTKLTSVAFQNGLISIGDNGIAECTALTNITLPNTVSSIGEYALYNDKALKNIYYTSGTKDKFKSISKGYGWKTNVPSTCVVHCSDGNYPISDFS